MQARMNRNNLIPTVEAVFLHRVKGSPQWKLPQLHLPVTVQLAIIAVANAIVPAQGVAFC